MTSYQKHKKRWSSCKKCDLYYHRKHVVLTRGKVPADVLFIGEAPGASEDVLGVPFVGPAGKLLDRIIERSLDGQWDYALTNLVACIPLDEGGRKAGEPSEECIEACAPRLQEFIGLCKPRLVIAVGRLAEKKLTHYKKWEIGMLSRTHPLDLIDIIHPAAILRMDISQRGLAVQRSIVVISDAVDELA